MPVRGFIVGAEALPWPRSVTSCVRYDGDMSNTYLPGGDLIEAGLADLANRTETDEALLVSMAAHRLRSLGFDVPAPFADAELRLYRRLSAQHGAAAHARYNALVRRLVSFQRAAACAR